MGVYKFFVNFYKYKNVSFARIVLIGQTAEKVRITNGNEAGGRIGGRMYMRWTSGTGDAIT